MTTRIGHYEVLDLLGDGGMGSVYRGRDPRFDRHVAIKVLHPQMARDPGIVERFKAEAVIQARLRHPNIITVLDFVAEGEVLAIVMELVEGTSLSTVIEKTGGPMEPARAVRLMSQVLSAMAYAHRQQLVHRDIKPSNVLVELVDGEELAKVMDFGIAKILGNEKLKTATGATMGTLAYMSPEQVRSPKAVDARSDIYSLGVVLFEMLTGKVPFDADSEFELMQRIVADEHVAPSRMATNLPAGFDVVVQRAMAKRPEGRFADCETFRRDLLDATKGSTAMAAPSRASAVAARAAPGPIAVPALPTLRTRLPSPADSQIVSLTHGTSKRAARLSVVVLGLLFLGSLAAWFVRSSNLGTQNAGSQGLVAYYSFDAAGSPGLDSAGGHHAASVINVSQVDGRSGLAGRFAGGYMLLPSSAALNLKQSDFTLAVFVNTTSKSNRNFFTKADPRNHQYGLATDGSRVGFAFDGGGGGEAGISATVISDGRWHHVAGVRRGRIAEVWIDGRLESSGAVSPRPGEDGAFAIGRDGVCCESFDGLLDEAKIWDRALSGSEIAAEAQR